MQSFLQPKKIQEMFWTFIFVIAKKHTYRKDLSRPTSIHYLLLPAQILWMELYPLQK